jgi:hypothetical protein
VIATALAGWLMRIGLPAVLVTVLIGVTAYVPAA